MVVKNPADSFVTVATCTIGGPEAHRELKVLGLQNVVRVMW